MYIRLHVVLGLLAVLGSQLLPLTLAQFETMSVEPTCSFNSFGTNDCSDATTCQGDCCYYAGFCTSSSSAANCVEFPGSLFPPKSGVLDTHQDSKFAQDGCLCDITNTFNGTVNRDRCNNPTTTDGCWGTIICADTLSTVYTCAGPNGYCLVSLQILSTKRNYSRFHSIYEHHPSETCQTGKWNS